MSKLLGDYTNILVTPKFQKEFFGKTCKKRFKTKKSEHRYRILHTQNSVGIKFELKLTISN